MQTVKIVALKTNQSSKKGRAQIEQRPRSINRVCGMTTATPDPIQGRLTVKGSAETQQHQEKSRNCSFGKWSMEIKSL